MHKKCALHLQLVVAISKSMIRCVTVITGMNELILVSEIGIRSHVHIKKRHKKGIHKCSLVETKQMA